MIRHARMRGHRALFLPGLDHASIAAQFVLDGILAKEGESRQSLGRERYLERMRAFVATTREVMLAQQRRVGASARLGPASVHDGRGLGQGRAGRVRAPLQRRSRLSHRGARQLVPGLPDERQRPRGHLDAGDRPAVVCPLPPDRPGHRQPDPDATITVATTRPETILGDTAVAVHPDDPRYTDLVGRTARIPFVERDVPIIADEVVERGVRDGCGEDHAGPRPRRPCRPACATASPHRRSSPTTRPSRTPAPATTGWTGTRPGDAIVADLAARGDLARRRPTRWSSGAASAAATSSSRGSRPSGSCGRGRSRRARSKRPGPDGRGSCPSASRRPGSTG